MTFPYHLRRLSAEVTRCASVVKRRATLVALLLVAGASGAALTPASASATPLPRINLKVLLLGTSSTQSDLVDWQAALQRESVPFTTILTSTAGRATITAATLSSTLADGTPVANYDAVIVANGALVDCTTSCASGLSQAEWNALEQYEKQFNIRQISGDVNPGQLPSPGPVYGTGMNLPTLTGALDGVSGTLTADGQKTFPYLNTSTPITIGTVGTTTGNTSFGYEATPSATASFDTLVSGPNASALVGIYTHPDGVQELVETYAQNQFLLQDQLLRHGAIAWVTRGVYFGDQRNYVETNIDDTFIPDDVWSTTNARERLRPHRGHPRDTERRRLRRPVVACQRLQDRQPVQRQRRDGDRSAPGRVQEERSWHRQAVRPVLRVDQPHLGSPEPRQRVRDGELHPDRDQREQHLGVLVARPDVIHRPDGGARQQQPGHRRHRRALGPGQSHPRQPRDRRSSGVRSGDGVLDRGQPGRRELHLRDHRSVLRRRRGVVGLDHGR